MVEKINTGSQWGWAPSPTGVHKVEPRRSKGRRREFRRHLEDRYSGEEREESENTPVPGATGGASESQTDGQVPLHGRLKKKGKLIDIHA